MLNPSRGSRRASLPLCVLVCVWVLTAASPARAALLSYGDSFAPPAGLLGGTLLDTLVSPFSHANFTGTLSSYVYGGDPHNPYGGLTFAYQITNGPPEDGGHDLHELITTAWGATVTDVVYVSGSGVVPINVDRLDPGAIRWQFLVAPEDNSAMLLVRTDHVALEWERNCKNIVRQGGEAEAMSLGLPEPSSALLLAAGAAVTFFRRRRA